MEILYNGCLHLEYLLLLYLLSAIISLMLFRKQKLGNVIANSICAIASVLGASTFD